MTVAVVTDSTAYLPAEPASRFGIGVVPLHVSIAGADPIAESEVVPADLARAMGRHQRVTTSGATPDELAAAYAAALEGGADAVVAVHLSRHLSGTWDAARVAAERVGADRVRVVDSASAGMGVGFPALAAAEAAARGAPADEVERSASLAVARTTTLFTVPTLEHLRRGGRIGTAAAVFGTALSIKPVLHVEAGRIAPLEKVRTMSRAVTRLVERAEQAARGGDAPVRVAVHHLAAPERAAGLAERLREALPAVVDCAVTEVGAVIGAHIGPGALGVVVRCQEAELAEDFAPAEGGHWGG
ncbi:DegV family protein [Salinifilum aidingensis]